MNITEFLEARIAADEDWCSTPEFEEVASVRSPGWGTRECDICWDYTTHEGSESVTKEQIQEHLDTAHNRYRVLDECRAKRDIIKAAKDYSPELEHGDNGEWAFDHILRVLAGVYSSHPDYDPKWSTQ